MSSSAATIDLERLLSPVSPDAPCGESLRWDPVWDELSQLRRSRKDPLDASADKAPEWDRVIDVASEALSTRTKDLLVAGWLTEALLRQKGFAGLRDGLKLIRGLVDRYWDAIHPLHEEGDLSNRAAPLVWLTSHDGGARMPAALREVPLAQSENGVVLNWNFWHLRRPAPQGKEEKEDAFKKRTADAEQKRLTFDSAVDATPVAHYQRMLADIDAAAGEIGPLAAALDQQLGDYSPNWGELKKSLDEIRVFIHGVLKRRGGLVEPAAAGAAAGASGEAEVKTTEGGAATAHAGPIRTRAEAIHRLEEAARFFSDTEPHSPVAYLVRRAIRWAGMPFEEVLGELVKDDKLVKQIGETLGIVAAPPEKKKSSD